MASTIEFSKGAKLDIAEATAYYFEQSPRTAKRFIAEVEQAARKAAANPKRWRVFAEARAIPLNKFPHLFVFSIDEAGNILVEAVAHPKRRPRYWEESEA
jgi:plasmid stabilization system protein ParE